MKMMKKRFVLLCCFVKHYSDIQFLDLWFDCCGGRDEQVSVWNNENEYENNEKMYNKLNLFCKKRIKKDFFSNYFKKFFFLLKKMK
jgi:hypothetical protein